MFQIHQRLLPFTSSVVLCRRPRYSIIFFIQRTAKSDSNLPQGNEISLLELNLFILSFFCSFFVLITVPISKFRTRTWGFSLSVSAVYGSVLFWWSHSIGVLIKHSKFRTKPFTVFPKNHNYFPAPPCPSKKTDFIVWILRHARRSFFSFFFFLISVCQGNDLILVKSSVNCMHPSLIKTFLVSEIICFDTDWKIPSNPSVRKTK